MEIPKSTVRFTQVVKECGRPEPVTLWIDPKKDPEFQAAAKKNRIMTVTQETVGTSRDFGVVGFHQSPHASYLLFPKSLARFEGKRVVGIKYDLLTVPKLKDPVKPRTEPAKIEPPKHLERPPVKPRAQGPPEPPPPKSQPARHRYRVVIRYTAAVDAEREVEAENAKEAGELALSLETKEPVRFPVEKIKRKLGKVRRV